MKAEVEKDKVNEDREEKTKSQMKRLKESIFGRNNKKKLNEEFRVARLTLFQMCKLETKGDYLQRCDMQKMVLNDLEVD